MAILLAISASSTGGSPLVALSFVVGAVASGLAGYFGMRIATLSNNRTTAAAKKGLPEALQVAFVGGSVMGMSVVGLALFGLGGLFIAYTSMFGVADGGMSDVLEVIAGFSMGASSIALFARVGGGIYTKAADVGADLVGKVEAGLPEDDPRNPATIADNVGDNVGDVAGMGADLFESYVGAIIGTMVLGYGFHDLPRRRRRHPEPDPAAHDHRGRWRRGLDRRDVLREDEGGRKPAARARLRRVRRGRPRWPS